ncbi:SAM-dependent methyltransferase [bacterium]|jgi:16S rRNA (cytidine1402-2'-O)-methyltransferase|nr:SAM-dependent methyltransferase [bacterium]
MKQGKLLLIPNLLGETKIEENLPASIKQTIERTNIYIVENVRSARRFIKKVFPKKNIDETIFFSYGKHDSLDLEKDFLLNILAGKDVGLISEAGVPAVADPGSKIIEYAHQFKVVVKPLVGPSSILMALMSSGMNGQNFAFNGYLPIDQKERIKKIKELENICLKRCQTQIFMETPYRNNKLYETLKKICNQKTRLCVASNITEEHESIMSKTIGEWKNIRLDLNKKPTIFLIS